MNKRMKFESYSHTTKLKVCALYQIGKQHFIFLNLFNDIFYITGTDIFASFICEMIYKRRILSHQTCQKKCFMLLRKIIVVVSLHYHVNLLCRF